MSDKSFTVRIDGCEIPEGPSETGDFGLSKQELELIIRQELHRRGSLKHRELFSQVCARVKIRPRGAKEEEMLRVFMGVLRTMRDGGRVHFKSDETATYAELPSDPQESERRRSSGADRPKLSSTKRLVMAQGHQSEVTAIKESSDEKEVNRYLRLGWTLIKTLRGGTKEDGEPHVKYVLAWRSSTRRPRYPRGITGRKVPSSDSSA